MAVTLKPKKEINAIKTVLNMTLLMQHYFSTFVVHFNRPKQTNLQQHMALCVATLTAGLQIHMYIHTYIRVYVL